MYDFAVDTDKIDALVRELTAKANSVEEQIQIIENGIAGLQEAWDGSSYQTFKAKCEEFYPAMHSLPVVLKAYSSLFSTDVIDAEETLVGKIKEAMAGSTSC